jgi:hypothetical protein
LHLDVLKDGTIRIEGRPETTFGTFPHNQPFLVQVTDHKRNADRAYRPDGRRRVRPQGLYDPAALRPKARQFSAVRLRKGTSWSGTTRQISS